MNKLKAAMIGFLPQDADPYQTLETYSKIGYRAFEGGGLLLKGDVAENRKRVEAMGMEPISISCGGGEDTDIAQLIRDAHAVGVKQVTCYGGIGCAYRFSNDAPAPTMDALLREAERFEKIAQELKKEDLHFCFHNHDIEFTYTLNGIPMYWLMAANAPSLQFELDVGWVTFGGQDPVTVMKTLGDRLYAMHVKDFTEGEVPREDGHPKIMPRFTTPGTGLLNLKGCLETACEMNIPYAIVEQDFQYNLTQLETLTAAYYNMKETGFVL